MKLLRSSLLLLVVVLIGGAYLYWNERGPAAPEGAQVLLRLAPEEISQIQTADAILRRDGVNWQVAPRNSRDFMAADRAQIEPVVESVQLVQSNAVIEKPEDLAPYGLETPRGFLRINDIQIEIGDSPSFDASRVYAKINEKIALVPASLADFALRSLSDWRDKAILSFDLQKTPRLSIRAPLIDASFSTDGATWQIEQPIKAAGETSTIESFVQSLQAARLTKWLDEKPTDLAKWGLEKPIAEVKIGGAKLKIGKQVGQSYAAQNTTSPAVFELPAMIFGLINRPLRVWRDKTVVEFDWDKIHQISLDWRGKQRDFVKIGKKWQAQDNKADIRINAAVAEILLAIRQWRAQDFVNSSDAFVQFGLEKPMLKLSGDLSLEVGQKGPKTYAHNPKIARGTIFVLPSDAMEDVKSALELLFPISSAH